MGEVDLFGGWFLFGVEGGGGVEGKSVGFCVFG